MNLHEVYLAAQIATNGGGLSDCYTKTETDQRIISKVAEIVANAPEDFDTLKEISDWIASHSESAAAMNSAIAANTTAIAQKVDKVNGKGLSTNDFTNALKTKLNGLENYDDTGTKAEIANISDIAAINRSTLGYQSKNYIKVTATTTTVNGVTMTVGDDGSLTLSGTATEQTVIPITPQNGRNSIEDLPTKLILSGGDTMLGADCCIGVELSTGANSGYVASFYDGDDGRLYDLSTRPTAKYWYAYMRIYEGVNVDGVVVYPMIRDASIADSSYAPYTKPSINKRLTTLEERIAVLDGEEEFNAITNKTAEFYFIKEEQ